MPSGPMYPRTVDALSPRIDVEGVSQYDYWRCYFAAQAMRAILGDGSSLQNVSDNQDIAEHAWRMADAMISRSGITQS